MEGSVVIASNTIKTILHRSWIRCTTHGFGRKRELINYKEANLGIVYEKRKKKPSQLLSAHKWNGLHVR